MLTRISHQGLTRRAFSFLFAKFRIRLTNSLQLALHMGTDVFRRVHGGIISVHGRSKADTSSTRLAERLSPAGFLCGNLWLLYY